MKQLSQDHISALDKPKKIQASDWFVLYRKCLFFTLIFHYFLFLAFVSILKLYFIPSFIYNSLIEKKSLCNFFGVSLILKHFHLILYFFCSFYVFFLYIKVATWTYKYLPGKITFFLRTVVSLPPNIIFFTLFCSQNFLFLFVYFKKIDLVDFLSPL